MPEGRNSNQLQSRVGSNPNLETKSADTWTLFTGGSVITPKFDRWTKGLSLTIDYWAIKIENFIQQIGSGVILANCDSRSIDQNYDLIQRDPTTHIMPSIIDTETNIARAKTADVDFGFAYRIGVYDLTENEDGGVFTHSRFNSSLNYGVDNFGAGINVNHVAPFRECLDNDCQTHGDSDQTVTPWINVDLYASSRLSSLLGVTSSRRESATSLMQSHPSSTM